MKTIWARIGMSVEITDEQYEMLRSEAIDETLTKQNGCDMFDDNDVPDWLMKLFFEKGEVDGDSYIPGNIWE